MSDPNERLSWIYAAYIDAFNAQDWGALERFLAPDLVFEWGEVMDDLVGRDAVFAFYRQAWDHLDERIEARILSVAGDRLTAWIDTELRIHRDWPDCPISPMFAGEVRRVSGEVRYTFCDDRIVHIV